MPSNKGFTLIEIQIALVLILIIVTAFMSLFVFSARVNKMSKTSVSSTYIARDNMEMVYNLSKTANIESGINTITIDKGYTSLSIIEKRFGKAIDGKYVTINLKESGNLTKVIVNVYEDNTLTNLEAKIEALLSWVD
jgi:prepilin-type N-terminal cleavage/methylation domain-containing protein